MRASQLTGIIGLTELLGLTPQSGAQRRYTSSIGLCVRGLLSVVNDMLTFARLEASELSLEKRWFDLRQCVEGAIAVLRSGLCSRAVEVVVDLPRAIPQMVMGDETRVAQVLIKYVSSCLVKNRHSKSVGMFTLLIPLKSCSLRPASRLWSFQGFFFAPFHIFNFASCQQVSSFLF